MTCAGWAERITALVDGELPAGERADLERHLAACAACREAREAEEAVAARLRALPRAPLPAGFSASVMGRVAAAPAPDAGTAPRARVIPYWVFLVGGSAAAAAVVAMVMVGTGPPREMHVAGEKPEASALPQPAAGPGPVMERAALDDAKAPAAAAAPTALPPAKARTAPAETPPPDGGAGTPAPAEKVAEKEKGSREDEGEVPGGGKRGEAKFEAAKEALRDGADRPGEDKVPGGGERAPAAEEATADAEDRGPAPAPEPPRLLLFYKADTLAKGQDAVEKALVSRPDLVAGRKAWRGTTASESDLVGRLREGLEGRKQDATAAVADPDRALREALARIGAAGSEKVLEVRVRAGDVEAFRGALSRSPALVEATALLASLDLDDAVLEEMRRKFRTLSGKDAPAGTGGTGFAAGGGGSGSGAGTEPTPPPPPTPEQLRRLAEPPPPGRPAPDPGAGGEVVLEIHLLAPAAPPATAPKPATPPK